MCGNPKGDLVLSGSGSDQQSGGHCADGVVVGGIFWDFHSEACHFIFRRLDKTRSGNQ